MLSTPSPGPARPDPTLLAGLRARIHAIERGAPDPASEDVLSTGAPEIDAALPWNGLPAGGLHEVSGDGAATGFCVALLARLACTRPGAPILWCQRERDLCGQGLAAFGLPPERLIIVHGRDDIELLWAMEEGLGTPGLAAVLGRVRRLPPIAGRRLQLAAEVGASTGLLLRPGGRWAPTAAALSRWRITAAPGGRAVGGRAGDGIGPPRWRVGLQRCRPGVAAAIRNDLMTPRAWLVEWCDETDSLAVVTELRDRPAQPAIRAMAM